jgi:uncharacterized protein
MFDFIPIKLYQMKDKAANVFGKPLVTCCTAPLTGFYRDGACNTGPEDTGTHIVCAIMTDEFLNYSRAKGNDLISPRPEFDFPGLKEGDCWCLCINRWLEAHKAGLAPPVNLDATHEIALAYVSLEILQKHTFK